MKVVAIIQARMGSSRLPGKMLMNVEGKPIIEHVFERIKEASTIDEFWLATTTSAKDNLLAEWAKQNNILIYRGSEEDVLDRYYHAAFKAKAEVIVRITGDCPLHDSKIIDNVVESYLSKDVDYVCNVIPPTYPDGLDVEIFSFKALEKAWKEAVLKSEREHVTPYIWKNSSLFRLGSVVNNEDFSSYRLTLDTLEDLDLINKIFGELKKQEIFGDMNDILKILRQHPEWIEINSKHKRNEGYDKSVKDDSVTSI